MNHDSLSRRLSARHPDSVRTIAVVGASPRPQPAEPWRDALPAAPRLSRDPRQPVAAGSAKSSASGFMRASPISQGSRSTWSTSSGAASGRRGRRRGDRDRRQGGVDAARRARRRGRRARRGGGAQNGDGPLPGDRDPAARHRPALNGWPAPPPALTRGKRERWQFVRARAAPLHSDRRRDRGGLAASRADAADAARGDRLGLRHRPLSRPASW
jgi:hypothetical protein